MDISIFNGLVNFLVVSVIFLIVIFISFIIFCKKFKFDKKNIKLYGLFLQLNNTSLIAISVNTINYLFLVWVTLNFEGLNIIYISIILILSLVSDFALDNFKNIPKTILSTILNCLAVEMVYLIYNYLTTEYNSIMLDIVIVLLIIFIFLYFTYNLLRNINNIVADHKHINKKKNYKV